MTTAADNLPFISVVVPVHNEEKYLARCLSALLQQDYPQDRYEIILVDDGSTDKSPVICQEYVTRQTGESPQTTYARIENSGLSAGRNTGIYLARGDLVAFIDGDALADKDWLIEIQKPFSDERVGVVGGRIDILNDNSAVARFVHIVRHHQMFGPKEYRNQVIGTNMAYRKAVFDQIGGFHEEFAGYRGEEICLNRTLSWHYRVASAPSAVVYHERPESLRQWLRIEFIDGCSRPLVEKASSARAGLLRHSLHRFEELSVATLPIWMLAFLSSRRLERTGLIGLIPGCIAMIRRHLFKQSSSEIRRRLKQEYHMPLAGVVYASVDWLSTVVKMSGRLRGLWVHRKTQLSTVFPRGDNIEVIMTNQDAGAIESVE